MNLGVIFFMNSLLIFHGDPKVTSTAQSVRTVQKDFKASKQPLKTLKESSEAIVYPLLDGKAPQEIITSSQPFKPIKKKAKDTKVSNNNKMLRLIQEK